MKNEPLREGKMRARGPKLNIHAKFIQNKHEFEDEDSRKYSHLHNRAFSREKF